MPSPEIEYRLPWHEIHEEYRTWPLSEKVPLYVSMRGEWEKLHQVGGGKGIKIGVGDTGVDTIHRQSGGDLENVVKVFDVGYGTSDRHGHGTFTTSQIGARSQGQGMIGMAPDVELYHAKVLSDGGSGSDIAISKGIDALANAGCNIISLSLGGSYSDRIESACRSAREAGILVIASMGNSGTRGDGHPGNSVHTVGSVAIDFNYMLASFSSRSRMAIAANFGVRVTGLLPGGKSGSMSGTSMSCPNEAGVWANVQSAELKKFGEIRTKTLDDVLSLVKDSKHMRDLGPNGHDVGYGYGYVEIWKVLETVLADEPQPPPPPTDDPFDGALVHFENAVGLYGPYRLAKK